MPKWNGGVIGVANNPTQNAAKGVWSLSEATKAIRAGLWPPSNAGADPYFENVTLLLPGDGTNGAQNNTFLDSSTNNFTITRNGNTTQGTFSPFSKVDGRWGNYFDGSGDYLTYSTPSTSVRDWWVNDFTVEAWVYPTTLTGWSYVDSGFTVPSLIGNAALSAANNYWSFGPISTGAVRLHYFNGGVVQVTSTATVNVNQWNHIAFTKTSSGIQLFVNGVGTTATAVSGTPQSSSSYPLTIGQINSTSINGYVSNLRIVNGTAVYSGTTYTVPTAPLTAITNTSFLTCQSNRFKDNSTNAFAITRNGDVAVTTFSPFPTMTAYAAGTNGGSAYFDEAGDYLATPTNAAFQLGTGDFSIEAWIYPTKTPAGQYPTIFRFESGGYNGNGITFFWRRYNVASTGVSVDCGGVIGLSGTSTVPVGAWTHVAFTRTGNDFALFVNGVREATTNNSNNFSTNVPVNIGYSSGNSEFPGYISSARVVKGSNPYGVGTTLTIPTAPLTAITNTSLLLNFTNGGIVDAAMSNDLETVGNAQISTTQSKWGGASISFANTGDNLKLNRIPEIGSGDFTFELWVYPSSFANYRLLFDNRTSDPDANGFAFGLDSNAKVYVYTNNGFLLTTTTALSANTWTHIALVRSGSSTGNLKIYINGTADATTATTTANFSRTAGYIGNDLDGTGAAFVGYIDDLRITKGYARYTSNFTAPTGPFNGFGD